jgi:MFS family permease
MTTNPTTNPPGPGKLGELRRGWRPLVAACVGIAFGLSPHSAYTIGIIASAMHADLDWPRGEILAATLVGTVMVILLGTFVGRLIDRIGARPVALASTGGVGLGLLLLSTAGSSLPGFYALWGLLTVLGLGTLPMTYAKIVTQWFDSARGLALGLALASTGLAGAFYPFWLGYLMEGAQWRHGFIGLAGLPLLISLPVQLLWLREPAVTGAAATGAAATAAAATAAAEASGLTLGEAVRRYRFWAAAVAAMLLNFASGGLLPNFFPLLTEGGLSAADATRALALLALCVTAGRLIGGFLLDRMWAPHVALVLIAPAICGAILLASQELSFGVAAMSVALIGIATGAEYDLLAYVTGRYFGRRHFSELFGLQFAVFAIGTGVAPGLFGMLRDRLGSFEPVLYLSVATMLASVVLLYTLGRYPAQYAPQR